MKKNMSVITLALVFSLVISSIVTAGGFYNFCPYCGGPIGSCYCNGGGGYNSYGGGSSYGYSYSESGYSECNYSYNNSYSYGGGCGYNEDYYYEENYDDCYYEDDGSYYYNEGCGGYENNYYGEGECYSDYNACGSGVQMMHWANLRDTCGNIIGYVSEGSYVEIIGTDCNDCSRTIIYDYSTGLQGSVSTVYIYGGSAYEYENPTEYGGGGCGYSEYGYNEYSECGGGYTYSDSGYYDMEEEYCYDNESSECGGGCGYYEEVTGGYTDYEEVYVNNDYSYYGEGCEGVWVDVDINAQTVNIYNGDTVILSSDCVTGLPGIAETPCGQYYIMDRQRGSVLSGVSPDGVAYARAVDYWMPFTESGCGFHDATWRDSFGGDIYESYGSYGCVNCEYDFVSQMYDLVDTGCLVNIH